MDLEMIQSMHRSWINKPDTSRGQKADSEVILSLIGRIYELQDALENIEQDTRNTSAVGHAGVTCFQCGLCNELAREVLTTAQQASEKED